jgi:hypothetical protein
VILVGDTLLALSDTGQLVAIEPTPKSYNEREARRQKVAVYWRPGEAKKGLADARRRARDAYDPGYIYQKWASPAAA